MRTQKFHRFAALAATLALSATGCTEWFAASHAASFGVGWLLGSQSATLTAGATVDRVCYENGVIVDCSSLPIEAAQ